MNEYNELAQILEHFHIHPESLNRFVIHLYDNISNKNDDEYIHDRVPNYLHIADFICEKHSKIFCDGIRNSFFGIVTIELIYMLESVESGTLVDFKSYFKYFKQISDRNVVEKLFEFLDQKRHHSNFEDFLYLLQNLIQANGISLLEVHQRLPLVKNIEYESTFEWRRHEEYIFNLLLNISCFENKIDSLRINTTFTTKNDINEEFDTQMVELNNKLNLPCAENSVVGVSFPKLFYIKYT